MRILKNGSDLILKRAIKFRCYDCGCYVQMDNTEYELKHEPKAGYSLNYAEATCPYCGSTMYVDVDENGFGIPPAHEAKMDEVTE